MANSAATKNPVKKISKAIMNNFRPMSICNFHYPFYIYFGAYIILYRKYELSINLRKLVKRFILRYKKHQMVIRRSKRRYFALKPYSFRSKASISRFDWLNFTVNSK